MNQFARKFSLPHNDILKTVMDGPDDFVRYDVNHQADNENFFYNIIKNAHPSYREEIADIYFSKSFHYEFGGTHRRYGDVMGKEATDKQIDNQPQNYLKNCKKTTKNRARNLLKIAENR